MFSIFVCCNTCWAWRIGEIWREGIAKVTLELGALLMFLLSSACAMLTRNAKGVDWMELDSGGLKSAQWVFALSKPPPGPYLA